MIKKLAFPTKTCYNNSRKTGTSEPVLIVRIVSNAKRTQKNPNYRRRKASYSLWCNIPNSLVLQKTYAEMFITKL